MAGVKGRSGRKTRYQQIQDGDLLSVCTNWLVNNFHTFDHDVKVRVALEIAKKGITQKLEHSGSVTWEGLVDEFNAIETRNTRSLQVIAN